MDYDGISIGIDILMNGMGGGGCLYAFPPVLFFGAFLTIKNFITYRPSKYSYPPIASACLLYTSYAGALVSALIPIMIFIPFQKYFVEGVTSSGVKG